MDLRTEIEIPGPPGPIWAVLTDFRSYPIWNPYLAVVRGRLKVGAELRILVSLLDGSELRLRSRITSVTSERELRWKASRWLPVLLTIETAFWLEPQGEQSTRVVHQQSVSGRLMRQLAPDVTLTMRGMVHMNEALKARAEAES